MITVFIDGENTFYHLFHILKAKGLVRRREDLVKFELAELIKSALGSDDLELLYYGVKLRDSSSNAEIAARLGKMIDHKRRWSGFLTNQKVKFVEAGRLKLRNQSEDRSEFVFLEKGVDVRMAVDMVDRAADQIAKEIVLLSSDSDLQSAIGAVQKRGVRVTYLPFAGHVNDLLAGSADSTKSISREAVAQAFKKAN